MSKIKDLYVEQEGIDDLMKPDERATELAEFLSRTKEKIELTMDVIKDTLKEGREISVSDDEEGYESIEWSNFYQQCDWLGEDIVDGFAVDEGIDLSDEEYADLSEKISKWLVEKLEDFLGEEVRDIEEDSKYYMQEEMERRGYC